MATNEDGCVTHVRQLIDHKSDRREIDSKQGRAEDVLTTLLRRSTLSFSYFFIGLC